MTYTEVFGGNTIYPSDVSYLAVALTGDIEFEWPVESAAPEYPLARIIDVIANGPHMMRLPDASIAAPGETVLFNVLTASSSECFVEDHLGNTIATLGVGEQWELYLTDNTTAAGEWQVFHFGASTATVQPSALAGYGITVTGSTLSQSVPVTTFNASPRSVFGHDRASALVWVGAGSASLDLPSVSVVGNNYFVSARNAGGGMLNLDPLGTELIDGLATVALSPGEGVVLVTDGLVWYTLGRGQAAIFAFDYTAIDLTGKPSPYVLSGSELNRISYKFTGALTHDMIVVVPSTVQQYWVDNSTTGAFTLALNTAGGSPVVVPQGSRGIYYCNGVSVVDADTSTGIALPINASDGGTGQTSYNTGDMLTASNPATLARLAAVPMGNALISQGAGVMPAWGDIDLTTTVTGVLPPANGGTGSNLAAFVPGYHIKGGPVGQLLSTPLVYDNGTTVGVGTSNPNPTMKLHVDNGMLQVGRYGVSGAISFSSANGTQAAPTAITAQSQIAWIGASGFDGTNYNNVANIAMYSDGAITPTSSPGLIQFNTAPAGSIAPSEKMRLTSDGNLGIGTTIPASRLHIDDGFISNTRYGLAAAALGLYSAAGTKAAPTPIAAFQNTGAIVAAAWDGAAHRTNGQIIFQAEAAPTAASSPGTMYLATTPPGATAPTNKVILTGAGNFGIGAGAIPPLALFHAAGTGRFDGDLTVQNIVTGQNVPAGTASAIELGANRTGAGPAVLDFHAQTGTDFDARVVRDTGVNGSFTMTQTGTGHLGLVQQSASPIVFFTSNSERVRIDGAGKLLVATAGVGMFSGPGNTSNLVATGDVTIFSPGSAVAYTFNTYWDGQFKAVRTGYGCLLRYDTTTGVFNIFNSTGSIATDGVLPIVSRFGIDASGVVSANQMSINGPARGIFTSLAGDTSIAIGACGTTRGVRFVGATYAMGLEGVDNTLSASFQPIAVVGTAVRIASTTTGNGLLVDGNCSPIANGGTQLGWTNGQFSGIYLISAPVVSSDEREKTWLGGLSPAEMAAAGRIIDELGFYRWTDMPDQKRHLGVRAQQVMRILIEEGLEDDIDFSIPRDVFIPEIQARKYSFVTYETWDEREVPRAVPRAHPDDIVEEETEIMPAGNRFGMNYTELSLFIAAAQHQRLNALEARLVAAGL